MSLFLIFLCYCCYLWPTFLSLQMIPLFPKLFISGSIHFKTDRLWILSLLYAGLNSDIDAKIYVKQEFLKLLLSFCASSLADHESKFLILQVVHILSCFLYLLCVCARAHDCDSYFGLFPMPFVCVF